MGMSASSDDDSVMSEINVTPLVDVMLVLLVVFLVTAPLLTNAVMVHLPKTATTAPPKQEEAVVLSVDAKSQVFIDRQPVALEAIEARLRSVHARNAEVAVHLNADEACNYGVVARVMSSVDRAGISRLSVLSADR